MKRGRFVLAIIFLFVLQIGLISSDAFSDNYSVESYHTGISGGYDTSSSTTDSEFVLTYQQGSGFAESSEYTANIGIFFENILKGLQHGFIFSNFGAEYGGIPACLDIF